GPRARRLRDRARRGLRGGLRRDAAPLGPAARRPACPGRPARRGGAASRMAAVPPWSSEELRVRLHFHLPGAGPAALTAAGRPSASPASPASLPAERRPAGAWRSIAAVTCPWRVPPAAAITLHIRHPSRRERSLPHVRGRQLSGPGEPG